MQKLKGVKERKREKTKKNEVNVKGKMKKKNKCGWWNKREERKWENEIMKRKG